MRRLTFVLALCVALPAGGSLACTGQEICSLGDRSYHIRLPDRWDGESPLPVLLHFHGWARQGDLVVRHTRIATGAVAESVLLVAPNGLNGSWAFRAPGSPDTEFAQAVIDDVAKRFPIDTSKVFVSGYSWGANMAWRFVCENGEGVAALLAVSGTLRQSENCATHPGEVRQVYGLNDGVLSFPFGPGGDVTNPVTLWRNRMGCDAETLDGTWAARPFLTFERRSWECTDGRVVLDIHPGGHFIPHDWIPLQIADLL